MIDGAQEQIGPIEDGLQLVKNAADVRSEKYFEGSQVALLTHPISIDKLGIKNFSLDIHRFTKDEEIDKEIEEDKVGITIDDKGEVVMKPLRQMMKEGYGTINMDSDTDKLTPDLVADVWSVKAPNIKGTTSLSSPSIHPSEEDRDDITGLFVLMGGGREPWTVTGLETEVANPVLVVKPDVNALKDLRIRFKINPTNTQGGENHEHN